MHQQASSQPEPPATRSDTMMFRSDFTGSIKQRIFPRRKAGQTSNGRSPGKSPVVLDLQGLSKYFSVSQQQACEELGIGLSTMKRLCRKFGIKSWPRQPSAEDKPAQGPATHANINPSMQHAAMWDSVNKPVVVQHQIAAHQAEKITMPHWSQISSQQNVTFPLFHHSQPSTTHAPMTTPMATPMATPHMQVPAQQPLASTDQPQWIASEHRNAETAWTPAAAPPQPETQPQAFHAVTLQHWHEDQAPAQAPATPRFAPLPQQPPAQAQQQAGGAAWPCGEAVAQQQLKVMAWVAASEAEELKRGAEKRAREVCFDAASFDVPSPALPDLAADLNSHGEQAAPLSSAPNPLRRTASRPSLPAGGAFDDSSTDTNLQALQMGVPRDETTWDCPPAMETFYYESLPSVALEPEAAPAPDSWYP